MLLISGGGATSQIAVSSPVLPKLIVGDGGRRTLPCGRAGEDDAREAKRLDAAGPLGVGWAVVFVEPDTAWLVVGLAAGARVGRVAFGTAELVPLAARVGRPDLDRAFTGTRNAVVVLVVVAVETGSLEPVVGRTSRAMAGGASWRWSSRRCSGGELLRRARCSFMGIYV